MALSYSEDRMHSTMIVASHNTSLPVMDGQTDGFTIAITALCITSYADAVTRCKYVSFKFDSLQIR